MAGTLKVGGNIIATHTGVEGTGQVSLTNVSLGGGAFMFRNKIINGNFDFWQRGTSQTSAGYGSADRWNNDHSGSSKTASQQAFTLGQTEVPGNSKYYLRHVVTSVSGSGNYCLTQQKIEGVSTLAGKTATLSFWAKADSNKNIATEFSQDFSTGGSPSSTVNGIGVTTHSLTTSWQKFTTTVSIPSISGKTLGTDGRDYLHLVIWFDSGSTYSSRNNSLGQQSGTFDIAQVQLEIGTAATPFEHRPIGVELSLCQRYFEKSYDLADGIGGNSAKGMIRANARDSGSFHRGDIRFKVSKRSLPEIKIYAYYSGTLGHYRDTSNGVDRAALSQYIGENSFEAYASGGVMSTGALHGFHYTANSEL